MSNRPNTHHRATTHRGRPARRGPVLVVVGGLLLVAVAAATALALSLGRPAEPQVTPDPAASPSRTREVNAMGMPVIETPGTTGGRTSVLGVEVVGANWDMGRVPLNVAVRPAWTLRNTSDRTVTVGEPKAEVREGCCPGPFALAARTLAPGDETTLTFELSMHPGMDGPHDLGVHVPLDNGVETAHLVLGVAGDFR